MGGAAGRGALPGACVWWGVVWGVLCVGCGWVGGWVGVRGRVGERVWECSPRPTAGGSRAGPRAVPRPPGAPPTPPPPPAPPTGGQIVDMLGQAAFSRAVHAVDTKTGLPVCLKVIKVRLGGRVAWVGGVAWVGRGAWARQAAVTLGPRTTRLAPPLPPHNTRAHTLHRARPPPPPSCAELQGLL